MRVSFSTDKANGKVIAVYITLAEGKVHRTVEVSPGECYVDEDRRGKPIGVEMLRPGKVKILVKSVARRYHIHGMSRAVNSVKSVLKTA